MENPEETRRAMCPFIRDFMRCAKRRFASGNKFRICFHGEVYRQVRAGHTSKTLKDPETNSTESEGMSFCPQPRLQLQRAV
jgi:hypothetical protein